MSMSLELEYLSISYLRWFLLHVGNVFTIHLVFPIAYGHGILLASDKFLFDFEVLFNFYYLNFNLNNL